MEAARNLLDVINDKWEKYHLQISEGCLSMLPEDCKDIVSAQVGQSCLRTLSSLVHLTKSGVMEWNQDITDPTLFYSVNSSRKVEIKFLVPVDSNDRPIGNLVARLTIPRVNISFACGTDGFFIEEILAYALPELRKKHELSLETLVAEIEALEKLTT